MFDWEVCLLTLQKAGVLLAYIALGYALRRTRKLPDSADRVMSGLVTMLFCPAYSIATLSVTMRPENLGQNLRYLGLGAAVLAVVLVLAFALGKSLGRNSLEQRSLTYAMTFSNYGYFGYPLVAGVLGQVALGNLMAFTITITLATNTLGYLLFAQEKMHWKKVLLTPMVLAVVAGIVLGLCNVTLPGMVREGLMSIGNCMSPVSMLLSGFVLGSLPLKELLRGWRSYLYGALRLLVLPAVFVIALYLLGVRGMYLLIPGIYLALPVGMNVVVFPTSLGYDTRDNAKMCFVSYGMSIFLLPVWVALLQAIM